MMTKVLPEDFEFEIIQIHNSFLVEEEEATTFVILGIGHPTVIKINKWNESSRWLRKWMKKIEEKS